MLPSAFSHSFDRDPNTPPSVARAAMGKLRKICSWCETELPATDLKSDDATPTDQVSHGICPQCADNIYFQTGVELQNYIHRLGVPILLVDEDVKVLAGNRKAFECLGLGADATMGKYAGEVFECQHARLPGGCGRSLHCSGCMIRRMVTDTLKTGRSYTRIPATLRYAVGEVASDRWIVISTAKAGDSVLLKVHSTNALQS